MDYFRTRRSGNASVGKFHPPLEAGEFLNTCSHEVSNDQRGHSSPIVRATHIEACAIFFGLMFNTSKNSGKKGFRRFSLDYGPEKEQVYLQVYLLVASIIDSYYGCACDQMHRCHRKTAFQVLGCLRKATLSLVS